MASSSSQSCNCDVFLSFRGEDTRKTFVDHLYTALVDRKIPTYKDDETLPRGESIRPSLFKAIKGSRIAVIIFSKNYADSSWCLDELAYIMKCKIKRGLIVMPVFYDVAPSEVRKQEGDFGKGFSKQEAVNISKVESWRKALLEASEISGWEPKTFANGHESKVTIDIADTISKKLYPVTFGVDEGLVGMGARLEELEAKLDIGSSDVQMVGIWGLGGGGKTTLAYSFYKKISHHFQGNCLIKNVRERSSTHHDLKTLQETIISRLSKTKIELQSVEEGQEMIQSRLKHSSVLLLLDDVDHIDQLDALAGSHSWFGGGSLIIVTTRDEHLLKTHKVDLVCPITLLSREEAIMLFNKHAYNKDNPLIDYEALSSRVITYAAGLPLALKVLGSFLYDKDEKEWMSTLARLKDIPEMKIIEKLKLSYDGLTALEKDLFLDIACFYRRMVIDDVMEALEACDYHPNVGISVLCQKSLITIENGIFDMHDLVQEMGHHIVRGEYPNDPSKHSRVWKLEEINNMCASDVTTENDQIEAICFIFHHGDQLSPFYKFVSNMKKLRYIHVKPDKYVEDKKAKGPTFLSNELHYIEWKQYPKTPFPNTFKAAKLVILKLSHSWQKELWKGCKHLPNLKVLKLSSMRRLLSTPDFDGLPSLQNLTLSDCDGLKKIHPSLGKHTCLEHVSVEDCRKLRAFPTIIRMTKLKTLEIKRCQRCLNFPKIESNMDNLVKLSLERVWIDVLPSIIERCAHLISLQLKRCIFDGDIVDLDGLKQMEEFELSGLIFLSDDVILDWLISKVAGGRDPNTSLLNSGRLPFVLSQLPYNLQKLNLSCCRLKDGGIPSCIGKMFNLEELDLSGNDFTRLDFTLSELTRLKLLNISDTSLVEFPKLPSSLLVLRAKNWRGSVTTIGDSLTNCKRLCEVSLEGVRILNGCNKLLESMLQGKGKAAKNHSIHLISEGIEIAKEFIPPLLMPGNTCRLKLPDNWYNDFSGFLFCAVETRSSLPYFYGIIMEQVMSGVESKDGVVWKESDDNKIKHVWYVSFSSLRHTTWWNSIYKADSISFKPSRETLTQEEYDFSNEIDNCVFEVRMVAQKSRETLTQEESDFSRYAPMIKIDHDSQHALEISPNHYPYII